MYPTQYSPFCSLCSKRLDELRYDLDRCLESGRFTQTALQGAETEKINETTHETKRQNKLKKTNRWDLKSLANQNTPTATLMFCTNKQI